MALDVCLVLQVNAVLVAQIVPVRRIRIVAVAHVVDVAALHQEHLVLHLFTAYGVSCLNIVLVAVYTLQLDRLSVQIVVSSCKSELVLIGRRILDFHLSETYVGRECLNGSALGILQFAHQCIAVRSLSTPEVHIVSCIECSFEVDFSLRIQFAFQLSRCGNAAEQGVLVGIKAVGVERILDSIALDGLFGEVLKLGCNMQFGVGIGVIQIWNSLDVADLHLRLGGKCHGTEDAWQAEHVLTFEEGSVGMAVNFYGHGVFFTLLI